MSARIVRGDCSVTRDHVMHVQRSRSMHECEEIWHLCPGGPLGDRRIRECDDIRALVDEVLAAQTAPEPEPEPEPELRQEDSAPLEDDDEPDWESIAEARAEARAEQELERAEAAYERYVYSE